MAQKSRWWTRLWRRRPRLRRMDPKFDDLNHRLDYLDETTQKLSKRLDDMDWRLAGLETKPPK